MKVGDLVKHIYGSIHGLGLVLDVVNVGGGKMYFDLMWNCHGHITFQAINCLELEKINHE